MMAKIHIILDIISGWLVPESFHNQGVLVNARVAGRNYEVEIQITNCLRWDVKSSPKSFH
jgi:hypothetical protein